MNNNRIVIAVELEKVRKDRKTIEHSLEKLECSIRV